MDMNRTAAAIGTDASPSVGVRTLLVGTTLSVAQWQHTLQVATPAPVIVGCLLPPAATAAAALPCPVLGDFDTLEQQLNRNDIEQVLVSLPLAMAQRTRELAGVLDRAGVTWRFLPTLGDQLAGRTTSRITGSLAVQAEGSASQASPPLFSGHAAIDPTMLIDRKPRALDEASIRDCITDKVVLITGAGGSIGSELARIVSRFSPRKLLLVERSENALFEIDREIARVYPSLARQAIMHDVTHRAGTMDLLDQHKPAAIFHAAAHKHVPMMEDHPAHAVENNFYGTRAIADAANACGAERFVMISSDKAVNPSSVMGATKRLAELYIQHLNAHSDTVYSMVRFGNVLGSACSVLPIWANQLAHGGPITVTHPDMTRYFMTIPEAAGLVLQAGAFSGSFELTAAAGETTQGGEVFLLDMGDPIRIEDLARRFVRAQGFEPDVDVAIQFTGIRPGEKLFEELAYTGEDMIRTQHASIRIWRTQPPTAAHMQQIIATFDHLRNTSTDPAQPWRNASRDAIHAALRTAIPEMVEAAA